MRALLVKLVTSDINSFITWNKDTFALRQSIGLQAIRLFQDNKDKNEYYFISFWNNEKNLTHFLKDRSIKDIFESNEVIWTKSIEEFPSGTMGIKPFTSPALVFLKYKTDNPAPIVEWNKSTFALRNSMGLQAIRAYSDIEHEEEFYAFSFWDSFEHLKAYRENKMVEVIFSNEAIMWYKILVPVEKANQGELPENL